MRCMRSNSDEKYVLELVAEILNEDYLWQKRFDTLLGDQGRNGRRCKLPVDSYFPQLNLIIEYHEKQHMERVRIMDNRMTISGVPRGEQRKIYDLRKQEWAQVNNIRYLIITYKQLKHRKSGKLFRHPEDDKEGIKKILRTL